MKKIIFLFLCIIPWFLSSIVPIDKNFYNSLNLPFFTPPPIFFSIAWTITYILIGISIYQILKIFNFKIKDVPTSYKKTLLINYLLNQSFQPVFFLLRSPFLGFVSTLATFISTLYLYEETSSINEKSTKYLNMYVLLSLFATVLSVTIYILNVR